jgi:hypothetical protein
VIWIGTCVGLVPVEAVRLFAMWSTIKLKSIGANHSCINALRLCDQYLSNPFPEQLENSFDLVSSPSQSYRHKGESDLTDFIFEVAERKYKSWRKPTAKEDRICGAIHSAICTLSEPHCRETGYNEKNPVVRRGDPIPPAVLEADDLTVGITIYALLAASSAAEALGEAAIQEA